MKLIFWICALLLAVNGFTQQINYNLSDVPDSLRKNAVVISKYDYSFFEVSSINRSKLTTHNVFVILNKNGNHYQRFFEYTDKFQSLGDVQINVYDSTGKVFLKAKKKDLQFNAYTDQLVDDSKNFYYSFAVPSYPAIVEIITEKEYKGTLQYPDFTLQIPELAVQEAVMEIAVPNSLSFRYKNKNTDIKPSIEKGDKTTKYRWVAKNLTAFPAEDGAIDYLPVVKIAPDRFEFGGYEGSLATWKEFGEWYGKLYESRDVLSAEKIAYFKDLVKDLPDERSKVRKIYSYLQDNFRYVSIQLGIGGLQPFPADLTDKNKYGDCKALSNFTKAALQAVGIRSHNAIIYSDKYPVAMETDFPKRRSNHVILCVPGAKDTIWLECTSKTSDFAYLGPSTENRNALLLTEKGGVLVKTPASDPKKNILHSYTTIKLEADGSGYTKTSFNTTGSMRGIFNYYLTEQKDDDQKSFLINYLGFKQPDQFKVTNHKSDESLNSIVEMELEKIHEFGSGSKMFMKPRWYSHYKNDIPKSTERTRDFYFEEVYETSDTTQIVLPEGYQLDQLPKPLKLSNNFAEFNSGYWFNEGTNSVFSTSSLRVSKIKVPANEFKTVQVFFDAVAKESTQRVVIKKTD